MSRRRLALALALALGSVPFAGSAPVAAADDDLLPDLKMAPIYEVRIERSAIGRKRLRFGTIVWNVGRGPLEVRADGRVGATMANIRQWIASPGGAGYESPQPNSAAFYSGDGHNHWHIGHFVVAALLQAPGGPPIEPRYLRKIGFCLTDLVRVPAALRPPGSPTRIGYPVRGCGIRASTSLHMGISVGFGDDYKPYFAHQAVDVTGLAAGTYRLCATVNGDGMWQEIDHVANNSYWLDLAVDPALNQVRVVGQGEDPCGARPEPIFYGCGAVAASAIAARQERFFCQL